MLRPTHFSSPSSIWIIIFGNHTHVNIEQTNKFIKTFLLVTFCSY